MVKSERMESKNFQAQNANSYGFVQQSINDNAVSFAAGKRSPHEALINPALFPLLHDFSNTGLSQNGSALAVFHSLFLFPFHSLTEKCRTIKRQHFRRRFLFRPCYQLSMAAP